MANIVSTTTDASGNTVYTIDPGNESEISLATAGTYVDKNIVFKINSSDSATVVTFTVGSETSTGIDGLTSYSLTADKTLSELLTAISNGNKVYGKLSQSGSVMSIGEGFPEVISQNEILFETAIKYEIDSSSIE